MRPMTCRIGRRATPAVMTLLLSLGTGGSAFAATWHIQPDGSGDAPTIQAGIDAAKPGDMVRLAAGTFFESNIRMKSGVVLAGSDTDNIESTIHGGYADRVLQCIDVDSSTEIRGIIITGGLAGWGGGINLYRSSPRITNVRVVGNSAGLGGGLFCYESSPTLLSCNISGNTAQDGGGLYLDYGSSVQLSGCIVADNVAGGGEGGNLLVYSASIQLDNCTLVGGSARSGAMVAVSWGSLGLDHSIMAFSPSRSAITCAVSSMVASCSNVFDVTSAYDGCLFGQEGVDGNISADPLFCGETGSDDLRLSSLSPCAPPNSPDSGLIGAMGVACGPVALVSESWGKIKGRYR